MQVLADGLCTGIPTPDHLRQRHRYRIYRGGDDDGGAGVQTGETGGAPDNVGQTDERGHLVGVAIENDGSGVQCGPGRLWVFKVEFGELGEIYGGEVGIG